MPKKQFFKVKQRNCIEEMFISDHIRKIIPKITRISKQYDMTSEEIISRIMIQLESENRIIVDAINPVYNLTSEVIKINKVTRPMTLTESEY